MLRDQDEKVESWTGLTFKVNEQENSVKKGYVGQVYNYYEVPFLQQKILKIGINNVSKNDSYER